MKGLYTNHISKWHSNLILHFFPVLLHNSTPNEFCLKGLIQSPELHVSAAVVWGCGGEGVESFEGSGGWEFGVLEGEGEGEGQWGCALEGCGSYSASNWDWARIHQPLPMPPKEQENQGGEQHEVVVSRSRWLEDLGLYVHVIHSLRLAPKTMKTWCFNWKIWGSSSAGKCNWCVPAVFLTLQMNAGSKVKLAQTPGQGLVGWPFLWEVIGVTYLPSGSPCKQLSRTVTVSQNQLAIAKVRDNP